MKNCGSQCTNTLEMMFSNLQQVNSEDEIKMSFAVISDILEGEQYYCDKLKMIYSSFQQQCLACISLL